MSIRFVPGQPASIRTHAGANGWRRPRGYPRAIAVALVVTEHRSWLDRRLLAHFEEIRGSLERLSATSVESLHYSEAGDLQEFEAVVLSGSFAPWATHDQNELDHLGEAVRGYPGPVLGICAGMQLQARFAGGSFAPAAAGPRKGFGEVEVLDDGDLLRGLPPEPTVYRHHSEEVVELPAGFRVLARSVECDVEAIADPERSWWGTQFHPERFTAEHPAGETVLRNFFRLAGLG